VVVGRRRIMDLIWASLGSVPPIVGAIVGALLGVLGTQLFNKVSRRPRPLIFIDRLKVDRSQRPPGSMVEPTKQTQRLMVDLANEPFVSKTIPLTRRIDEEAYVTCLHKALKEVEEAREHLLTSVKDTAMNLGEYANRERYEKFQQVWAEEQKIIWPLLNMLVLREATPWEDIPPSDTENFEDSVDPGIDVDDNGDLYIHLNVSRTIPFSRSLSFAWSGQRALAETPGDPIAPVANYVEQVRAPRLKKAGLEMLARKIACAVLSQDRGQLRVITNWLYEAAQSHKERLDILQERIEEELRIHNRLVIQGQLSNTGGSPFSVLNDSMLFVETKGHPYTEGEGGSRTQLYFDRDTEIGVMIANPREDGSYEVPVSIEPGDTYRFEAVSTARLEEMEHSRVLLDIFNAGDKLCYMGVRVTLPGRSRRRSKPRVYTSRRLFRDWKAGVEIPQKRRVFYAPRAWLLRKLQGSIS
jgi:hypothetical protein